jgi:hypothetical protein
MQAESNPYAPPVAKVADSVLPRGVRPNEVTRASLLLCIAYVLSMVHVGLLLKYVFRTLAAEPAFIVTQSISLLFYAALIYCISRGQNWARLTYLILIGIRVANVAWTFRYEWSTSKFGVMLTVLSFVCQIIALYWLFTDPGRLWFRRSRA